MDNKDEFMKFLKDAEEGNEAARKDLENELTDPLGDITRNTNLDVWVENAESNKEMFEDFFSSFMSNIPEEEKKEADKLFDFDSLDGDNAPVSEEEAPQSKNILMKRFKKKSDAEIQSEQEERERQEEAEKDELLQWIQDGIADENVNIIGSGNTDIDKVKKEIAETDAMFLGFDEPPAPSTAETPTYPTESAKEVSDAMVQYIDGFEIALTTAAETIKDGFIELPVVRNYKNKAVRKEKPYVDAKEETGFKKKLIVRLIVVTVISLFVAIKAAAYSAYIENNGLNEEATSFNWVVKEKIPLKLDPFDIQLFGKTFLIMFFIASAVAVLTWLDSDQKKRARIGHEHGAAKLATGSDYTKYKRDFMEEKEYAIEEYTTVKGKKKTKKTLFFDNNMLFGKFHGQDVGLSLDNQYSQRSANVLVIGGTGSGKTYKYIKPNLLQENCSMIITDPSGDIFDGFAPYLLQKGYNVYIYNVRDLTISNHYNPLLSVRDDNGNIVETEVDVLVDLYMKNAKGGKDKGGGDPFWDKAEKSFLSALIYYVLESDEFADDGTEGKPDKCFKTILELSQLAKSPENGGDSELSARVKAFHDSHPDCKCWEYYATFLTASPKTADSIVISTGVDLQVFATKEVDYITRLDYRHPQANIDIERIATEQSYLFLSIPQVHEAYNFLIAMLYSQLYSKLYEMGEKKLKGSYHIGYKMGMPVFSFFGESASMNKKMAEDFYATVTKDNIKAVDYINNKQIYNLKWKRRVYKSSLLKEPLEKYIDDLPKMVIWQGNEYIGHPALPIHINFLLDEFANIGEIPNFLKILATSRKYRIGSHVVVQSLNQLKTMYKENEWDVINGNCDTIIFLGVPNSDVSDMEFMQKTLGKTTIMQRSKSTSKTGNSISYTPTQVDLMSMDEISAINNNGRDDEIIYVRNSTPFLCKKLLLKNHPRWKDVKAVKHLKIKRESGEVEDFNIYEYYTINTRGGMFI